jgi:hypothetical protein
MPDAHWVFGGMVMRQPTPVGVNTYRPPGNAGPPRFPISLSHWPQCPFSLIHLLDVAVLPSFLLALSLWSGCLGIVEKRGIASPSALYDEPQILAPKLRPTAQDTIQMSPASSSGRRYTTSAVFSCSAAPILVSLFASIYPRTHRCIPVPPFAPKFAPCCF